MSWRARRDTYFRRVIAPIRRSLQAKLVASVLAIGTVTTLLTGYIAYSSARDALVTQMEYRLASNADRGVMNFDQWLDGQRALLDVAAGLDQVVSAAVKLSGDPAPTDIVARRRLEEFLRRLRQGASDAEELQLLSPIGGRVVASTESASVGSYSVSAPYFSGGRDTAVMQAVYPSPSSGRPRLTIATPVRDASRRSVGVLVAHLDLQRLEALLLGPMRTNATFDVYLVNRYRDFVSADRFGRAGFRRGARSDAIERARGGENGVGQYDTFDGRPVIGAWRWLPDVELALLVETPTAVAFESARHLLAVVLSASVVAVLLLSIGVLVVTSRITRPILFTAAAAARVAAGDFTTRAIVTSDDEVGELARSFNRMTEQLDTLYRGMRGQVDATQDALRQVHEGQTLLHAIVDNASTLICVVNVADRILLANRSFLDLFEVDGDGVGQSLHRTIAGRGATDLPALFAESRAQGAVIEREFTLVTRSEAHVWHAACFPLRSERGEIYAVGMIGTDLTERARAEEERRQSDARVQQARKLESLGVMAGGIAHDFNNILGAILANADLALESRLTPDDVRESLREIVTASRRAADLTRQMLAYAGRASFEKSVFDLHEILGDMARLVRASHSKRVDLVMELGDGPAWVFADSAQLSQVVLNLLTNAMEAIGDDVGRVTVNSTITSTSTRTNSRPPHASSEAASAPHGWQRVSICDTGAGMDAERQRRIFEPFFTTKESGRGLGLSAVVGIVRSSGGALDVESAPGAGTRFDLYLPRCVAPVAAPPAVTTVVAEGRTGLALVVDDDEALRTIARRVLERTGFEVLESSTGEEGVAVHRHHVGAIRLVVLDLTMPGMNGVDALREIRRVDPAVPVIVASGYAAQDSVEDLRSPGVSFLQKPYSALQLMQLATELTSRQRT